MEIEILELSYKAPQKLIGINPDSFNPRKGIMTKYGKKLIEYGAKYYKGMNINNSLPDRSEGVTYR
jgi:hypothetical protein